MGPRVRVLSRQVAKRDPNLVTKSDRTRGGGAGEAGSLLEGALSYAARGWPVFPCCEMRGGVCSCWAAAACESPGKHPWTEHGFYDASADLARVREWWSTWPNANVGIATGAASALVVLDVDPRKRGDAGLDDLQADLGRLPDAPTVHTGSGGLHVYFAYPDDAAPVPCRTNVGGYAGIDVRGDGGYVIAPPSNHHTGGEYLWDTELDETTSLPPVPPRLLTLIRDTADRRVDYEARPWDGELAPAVLEVVAQSERVYQRFMRDASGLGDPSSSGVDYSFACMLAWRGLDGAAVENGIRASREAAGLPQKRPGYYALTVSKALGAAAHRPRPDASAHAAEAPHDSEPRRALARQCASGAQLIASGTQPGTQPRASRRPRSGIEVVG